MRECKVKIPRGCSSVSINFDLHEILFLHDEGYVVAKQEFRFAGDRVDVRDIEQATWAGRIPQHIGRAGSPYPGYSLQHEIYSKLFGIDYGIDEGTRKEEFVLNDYAAHGIDHEAEYIKRVKALQEAMAEWRKDPLVWTPAAPGSDFPERVLAAWYNPNVVISWGRRYGKSFVTKFLKFQDESDLKGTELIEAFYKSLRDEKDGSSNT